MRLKSGELWDNIEGRECHMIMIIIARYSWVKCATWDVDEPFWNIHDQPRALPPLPPCHFEFLDDDPFSTCWGRYWWWFWPTKRTQSSLPRLTYLNVFPGDGAHSPLGVSCLILILNTMDFVRFLRVAVVTV